LLSHRLTSNERALGTSRTEGWAGPSRRKDALTKIEILGLPLYAPLTILQ
jgi:hypothetical protein